MTDPRAEQVLAHLGPLIADETGVSLTAERVAAIDAALAPAAEDRALAARLLEAPSLATEHDASRRPARAYAAAALEAHAGRPDAARQRFHHVIAALEQGAAWGGFAAASERALALAPAPDFARALARAWEKGGPGTVPAALLESALPVAPDDHRLLWAAGFALIAGGRAAEGRRHVALSLGGFIQKRDLARAEEGFLALVESDDPAVREALFSALVLLTRQEGADLAAPFWDLAGDLVETPGLEARAWEFFRDHLARHPDHDRLRPAALRALRGVARARGISEDALAATGIGGTLVPAPRALARVECLLAWPPGLFVDHKHYGVGRVVANDGETLRIQFPTRTADLSMEIAQRSLLAVDPRDLKARLAWDREGIAREVAEDPVSLVHAALVSLGGEGTKEDLKRVLVPQAVAVSGWEAFWRTASKAMKDDARIDLSQTARRLYRVGRPGEPRGEGLPEFDVKTPLVRRVETLERFLDENPDKGDAVVAAHGETVARMCVKEPSDSEGRLAGALLLHRLGLLNDDAARATGAIFFAASEEFPSSVSRNVQERCLALAAEMEDPVGVLAALLASRTKSLRDEALDRLAAHLGEGYLGWILRLMRRSPERTGAILHVAGRREIVEGWPAWDALLALVRIVAAPPKPAQQKQALAEIEENAALHKGLAEYEPEPETGETLRLELATWRASERLLVPLLDALDAIGRGDFAERVRAARRGGKEAPAREAAGSPGPAAHPHLASHIDRLLMTRSSYRRLADEIHRVGTELKTSIPKAIETARAHGDLSENAEYEAAKEKQRRYAARLTELEERMNRAKIIDGSVVAPGVAGPGTEVVIEDVASGERETYWILGEGDDHLGEHVISYRAPLGKALAGRRAEDEAAVPRGGGGERRVRVVSVAARLPEA